MFAKLAIAAIAVAPVFAHMEMVDPTPLRSQKNPQYKDSPKLDYSYKAPMGGTGADFPCKGYAGDVPSVSTSVATVNAGSNFPVQLAGGAVHEGGSCQFSFSYDGGNTWGVVHQVIGNCPAADQKFDVPIPAEMPSGTNVLFAWTWFNKVGNREMYMNCAAVDVLGTAGAIELPQMFRANTFGGECTTKETFDVDFMNPADSVGNCPADKLVTPDKKVTIGTGAPSAPSTPPTTTPPTTTPGEPEQEPCPPETPDTTTAPPTTTGTTPPPAAGGDAWAADKVYVGGATTCFNAVSYTAKWWTQAEEPGKSEVWTAGGAC